MSASSSRALSEWERHWPMLLLTLALGVALALLEVHSDGRVGFRWRAGELPDLPPLCLSRRLFGVDCPGCGLTRSLVSLAHGELATSWSYHRLGWVVGLALVVQFLFRIFALIQWKRGRAVSCRWFDHLGVAVVVLLVANWCLPDQ